MKKSVDWDKMLTFPSFVGENGESGHLYVIHTHSPEIVCLHWRKAFQANMGTAINAGQNLTC